MNKKIFKIDFEFVHTDSYWIFHKLFQLFQIHKLFIK